MAWTAHVKGGLYPALVTAHSCDKYPTGVLWGERVYFDLQLEATSPSRWECEPAGHSTSIVESIEMKAAAQLTFYFLFSLGPQPTGWCHPHSDYIYINKPNLDTPSQTYPEIGFHGDSTLYPAELTISINHHIPHGS